jgi:hypothetical protein
MSVEVVGDVAVSELTAPRWLAQRLLDNRSRGALRELAAPRLVSRELAGGDPGVASYVLWWVRNAERGGRFAAKARWLRWLPAPVIFHLLLRLGYDGLIYIAENAVIGHLFFQRHGDSLHGFSIGVDRRRQGRSYPLVIVLDFLAHAASSSGIVRARVGTGRSRFCRLPLEIVKRRETELAWRVGADGWVSFSR